MGPWVGGCGRSGMSGVHLCVSTRPLPGPPPVLQAAGGGGHGREGLVHAGRGGRRCACEGCGCTGCCCLASIRQLVRHVLLLRAWLGTLPQTLVHPRRPTHSVLPLLSHHLQPSAPRTRPWRWTSTLRPPSSRRRRCACTVVWLATLHAHACCIAAAATQPSGPHLHHKPGHFHSPVTYQHHRVWCPPRSPPRR